MNETAEHAPKKPPLTGALFGLTAALLFGASMPFAKALLSDVQPFLLAGLFYLGSGTGLLAVRKKSGEAKLRGTDWVWLCLAICFGGIGGGLFLMWGLQSTPASDASLLLNLEGVFGALIAWIIFREHANKRVVLGMILLSAGAMTLSLTSDFQFSFSISSLGIVLACLCWAIDNNLTRKISGADPVQTACLKGLVAGIVNITIGLFNGATMPAVWICAAAMVIGFLSYGVSLVLYILGLRHVGAARTSAYFSAAPFIGAAGSILFLHEPVTTTFIGAAALMAAGLWLHLTEQHSHSHTHEPIHHEHAHVHDEHHQHEHTPEDPPGEPHSHAHRHAPITHSHPHMPDIHHIHSHD